MQLYEKCSKFYDQYVITLRKQRHLSSKIFFLLDGISMFLQQDLNVECDFNSNNSANFFFSNRVFVTCKVVITI